VPDNKKDAVPCERSPNFHHTADTNRPAAPCFGIDNVMTIPYKMNPLHIRGERPSLNTWEHARKWGDVQKYMHRFG
jgi:hypothetical protein